MTFLLILTGFVCTLFGGLVGFAMGKDDALDLYVDEQAKRVAAESEALYQKRCRQLLEDALAKKNSGVLRDAERCRAESARMMRNDSMNNAYQSRAGTPTVSYGHGVAPRA